MNSFLSFFKKEWLAQKRSFRLIVLTAVFVFVGVMNPVTAYITPWLMEALSESMSMSGMSISAVPSGPMESWVQFFKNMPIALIAFVVLESSLFTREYQSGTLILTLTKGLSRRKVLFAKALMLLLLWTALYWLCFAVSLAGSALLWSEWPAQHMPFAAMCWYLMGAWVCLLMVLFSAWADSNILVLAGSGGAVLLSYLLSILPKLSRYLPTMLMDGNSLIYGVLEPVDYVPALIVSLLTALTCVLFALPTFDKKQL